MTPPSQPGTLVLIRHGQSTANQDGTFTGFLDVDLTPEVVFTFTPRRAVESTRLILDVLGSLVVPVEDWRLNERNYGALTGRAKGDVLKESGAPARGERVAKYNRLTDIETANAGLPFGLV